MNADREEWWQKYQSLTTHWTHADQQRRTILYNFLMAGSVLILSWVAIFAIQQTPLTFSLLTAISLVGIVASALRWIIASRSTGYIDMYEHEGRTLEDHMDDAIEWPFHRREAFRQKRRRVFGKDIRVAAIAKGIPQLFLAFFVVSLAIAVIRIVMQ